MKLWVNFFFISVSLLYFTLTSCTLLNKEIEEVDKELGLPDDNIVQDTKQFILKKEGIQIDPVAPATKPIKMHPKKSRA